MICNGDLEGPLRLVTIQTNILHTLSVIYPVVMGGDPSPKDQHAVLFLRLGLYKVRWPALLMTFWKVMFVVVSGSEWKDGGDVKTTHWAFLG